MNQADLSQNLQSLLEGTKPTGEYINSEHILITRCDAVNLLLDLITAEKIAVLEEVKSKYYNNKNGEMHAHVSPSDIDTMITQIRESHDN